MHINAILFFARKPIKSEDIVSIHGKNIEYFKKFLKIDTDATFNSFTEHNLCNWYIICKIDLKNIFSIYYITIIKIA